MGSLTMRVGDLVTLSAKALKTVSLEEYREDVQAGKLIGLITKIDRRDRQGNVHRYPSNHRYSIQWIGRKYPRSRSYYHHHPSFFRDDLKYVQKA